MKKIRNGEDLWKIVDPARKSFRGARASRVRTWCGAFALLAERT